LSIFAVNLECLHRIFTLKQLSLTEKNEKNAIMNESSLVRFAPDEALSYLKE